MNVLPCLSCLPSFLSRSRSLSLSRSLSRSLALSLSLDSLSLPRARASLNHGHCFSQPCEAPIRTRLPAPTAGPSPSRGLVKGLVKTRSVSMMITCGSDELTACFLFSSRLSPSICLFLPGPLRHCWKLIHRLCTISRADPFSLFVSRIKSISVVLLDDPPSICVSEAHR